MATRERPSITGAVLSWAIDSSGGDRSEIADRLKISLETLRDWESEKTRPNWSQLRDLAGHLHRPAAVFFLPRAPKEEFPRVELRLQPGAERRSLNSDELLAIRSSHRLQRIAAWTSREFGEPGPNLPSIDWHVESAEDAGQRFRAQLSVPIATQARWKSTTAAYPAWRDVTESLGIAVFSESLGEDSCQGFSLWDSDAPVVVINTSYGDGSSRVFTLFHEIGHLLTRTSSACDWGRSSREATGIERWCERFAVAVLLPKSEFKEFLSYTFGWRETVQSWRIDDVRKIADYYKVSLRTAALRLIEVGAAEWPLFEMVSKVVQPKRSFVPPKVPRRRPQLRLLTYGRRIPQALLRAARSGTLAWSDVADYLDITGEELVTLERDLTVAK